jgi:hypothetical protein
MGIFEPLQHLPDGGYQFRCVNSNGVVSRLDVLKDQHTGLFYVATDGRRHPATWDTFDRARDFARGQCERSGHVPRSREKVRDLLLRYWQEGTSQ